MQCLFGSLRQLLPFGPCGLPLTDLPRLACVLPQTVHFLADPRVGRLLTASYGYLLKTDLDCFITATLIHHFPQQLEVGRSSVVAL